MVVSLIIGNRLNALVAPFRICLSRQSGLKSVYVGKTADLPVECLKEILNRWIICSISHEYDNIASQNLSEELCRPTIG